MPLKQSHQKDWLFTMKKDRWSSVRTGCRVKSWQQRTLTLQDNPPTLCFTSLVIVTTPMYRMFASQRASVPLHSPSLLCSTPVFVWQAVAWIESPQSPQALDKSRRQSSPVYGSVIFNLTFYDCHRQLHWNHCRSPCYSRAPSYTENSSELRWANRDKISSIAYYAFHLWFKEMTTLSAR